jgi:hypothetical protein
MENHEIPLPAPLPKPTKFEMDKVMENNSEELTGRFPTHLD